MSTDLGLGFSIANLKSVIVNTIHISRQTAVPEEFRYSSVSVSSALGAGARLRFTCARLRELRGMSSGS